MDTTLVPLTPREFYDATLRNSGIDVPPADVTKIAEARKESPAVVKLAQAFFEQLQKDNVQYTDEAARVDDAFNMAKAYVEHEQKTAAAAREIASAMLQNQLEAAVKFAEANGLADVDPVEILHTALEEAKSAADKLAMHFDVPANVPNAYVGGIAQPSALNLDQVAAHITQHQQQNYGPMHPVTTGAHLAQLYGSPENARAVLHNGIQYAQQSGSGMSLGQGISEFTNRAQAQPAGKGLGGMIARNPGMAAGIAGAGILGAGALYWMHKKRQEENERQRQLVQAASLPPVAQG